MSHADASVCWVALVCGATTRTSSPAAARADHLRWMNAPRGSPSYCGNVEVTTSVRIRQRFGRSAVGGKFRRRLPAKPLYSSLCDGFARMVARMRRALDAIRHTLHSGVTLLAIAKLNFMVAAYATTLVLTRLVDPTTFGSYNVVARWIAVPNMVLVQSIMYAVSRPLAAEYEQGMPSYVALRRRGFSLALGIGVPIAIAMFALAPWLAARANDPELTSAFRIVAPICAVYAVYAVNVGTLNARQHFGFQAALDIVMALSKAGLTIAAAAIGLSLAGMFGGFTLASVFSLVCSAAFIQRLGKPPSASAMRNAPTMTGYLLLLMAFTAGSNALSMTDITVLKFLARTPDEHTAVGFYSSAQLVALIPFLIMNALSGFAFPMVASLSNHADVGFRRAYVSRVVTFALVLLVFMSTVAGATARGVQLLLFRAEYAEAAPGLTLMVWGYAGFGLLSVSCWILSSARESIAAFGSMIVTAIVFGASAHVLANAFGAAAMPAIVLGVGVLAGVLAVAIVRLRLGAGASWKTLAALGVCTTVLLLAGREWMPTTRPLIVVKLAGLSVTFVAGLRLLGYDMFAELKTLRRAKPGAT